ncbi:MAG: DUF4091 domain-containing protein [Bacteroidales bacterium]
MKKHSALVFSIASILLVLAGCGTGNVRITLSDELDPLYPDSQVDSAIREITLDAARGTIAAVHLLVNGLEPGSDLILTVNGQKAGVGTWYRLIDVPVNENTGLDSRTEKFTGQVNPYVLRRAPFRIFEAMEPVAFPVQALAGTEAYRLEVPIDHGMDPGRYHYRIRLTTKGLRNNLDLNIQVSPATVPELSASNLNYVNWHSNGNIARDHELELWSEPFWEMLGRYARLMAKGRQNTFWFIWSDFFQFDSVGQVTGFEGERLERYINTFLAEGLTTIQGAPFCRRRDWGSDAFLVAVPTAGGLEIPATSQQGLEIIREMAGRVAALMERNGWSERWVQGVFDEPTNEYVSRYQTVVEWLKEIVPGIRVLEATMTVSLAGVVDYWCPQVQEYQAHRDFFEERKRAGDQVWVYTCLIPGGPWINRLVDQERLRQVYVGWACAVYDLQGFLHWGLNHHRGNALEELIRQHGDSTNFLPAGDSHIIYPRKEGPLSGLRFEAHRIGMEDYELLLQLKAKDPDQMNELISKLFRAFNDYSTNSGEYRAVKAQLLQSLGGVD